MSYAGTIALQGAVYLQLRTDPAVGALVGDAIYDAMPAAAPSGTYVSLGPEVAKDAGDMTARAATHDSVVSVVSGADEETAGFQSVKAAAAAVADALESADLPLDTGRLTGLWFLRATALRADTGSGRRVDLTFRAFVDLD